MSNGVRSISSLVSEHSITLTDPSIAATFGSTKDSEKCPCFMDIDFRVSLFGYFFSNRSEIIIPEVVFAKTVHKKFWFW